MESVNSDRRILINPTTCCKKYRMRIKSGFLWENISRLGFLLTVLCGHKVINFNEDTLTYLQSWLNGREGLFLLFEYSMSSSVFRAVLQKSQDLFVVVVFVARWLIRLIIIMTPNDRAEGRYDWAFLPLEKTQENSSTLVLLLLQWFYLSFLLLWRVSAMAIS